MPNGGEFQFDGNPVAGHRRFPVFGIRTDSFTEPKPICSRHYSVVPSLSLPRWRRQGDLSLRPAAAQPQRFFLQLRVQHVRNGRDSEQARQLLRVPIVGEHHLADRQRHDHQPAGRQRRVGGRRGGRRGGSQLDTSQFRRGLHLHLAQRGRASRHRRRFLLARLLLGAHRQPQSCQRR